MSIKKYFPYRGKINAIAARDQSIFFITQHEENISTPLYQLDLDSLKLTEHTLATPANALLLRDKTTWVGSRKGIVYRNHKKISQLDEQPCINALLLLSATSKKVERLAVLVDKRIEIIDAKSGTTLQAIDLSETATAMATDNSGQWLVVGTSKGNVLVYEDEIKDEDELDGDAEASRDEFMLSESAKLHEGAITSLLFDPHELRFL